MKGYGSFKASIKILVIFALSAGMLLVSAATFAQGNKEQTSSTTKWEWSDDGWRLRLAVNGKAEFTDDYSDVRSVSEGGSVRLEEESGGQTRRVEVRRDSNGQLVRSYYVNGDSLPLDSKGRAWMAKRLLQALRQGAIDVDPRVQALLRRGGVKGVFDEIEQVSGDYGKRVYFVSLVKNGNLSSNDRQRVLQEVSRQITDDYEKAGFLRKTAGMFLEGQNVAAFFQSIETIQSDSVRRGILSELLQQKNLSEEALAQVVESAARISSDYEKARFLIGALNLYDGDNLVHSAFLKTIETIKTDYQRGRVLSALSERKQVH